MLKRLRALAMGLTAVTAIASTLPAAAADAPAWVNVTNNVGGEIWGAYGVTALAIALEVFSVRARWRAAKKQARS